MNLGPAEILVILVVALIVFGPKRLPEVGRQVGKAVRELRKMQDTVKGELEHVMHHDVMSGSTTSSTYENGSGTEATAIEAKGVEAKGIEAKGIEEGDHSMPSVPEVSGNGSKPEPHVTGPHVIDAGDTDDGFAAPGTFS